MNDVTRRSFLAGTAATAAAMVMPPRVGFAAAAPTVLTAAKARVAVVGRGFPETECWTYNGAVPGPVLRVRQGGTVRVTARNRLAEPTTVHWHGLRLPNAMDGVPYVTQEPIAAGGEFAYEFKAPDAGTFWYHPHINSSEQVARGLAGVLIVEEAEPVRVDREVLWVLDDWRLNRQAEIVADFGHPHDLTHAGRLGNTPSINGAVPQSFAVRAGERIRLRLANVANARTFGLRFEGLAPRIIALDGQPVEPHAPADGMVVLAASQRADVILDLAGKPGDRKRVIDGYYGRAAYRLVDLVYSNEPALREAPPDWPVALKPNPLPEPDLKTATRHEILLEGGAMSAMMMRGGGPRMGPGMGGMGGGMGPGMMGPRMGGRAIWAINGTALGEGQRKPPPLLTFKRGSTQVLAMRNDTAFEHPMHIHGHSFRVISRNGRPTQHRAWRDTVLVQPRETVEIAFVADNPGDWMFHCHVLEHLIAGMMAVVRVM